MPSQADINNLAWTMLGEASPSDSNAMLAVGNTVLNRMATGRYGSSITAIVKSPNQYAAWGIGSQAASQGNHPDTRFPENSAAFQRAQQLATALVNGQVQDNTGGAVSYRAASAGTGWARGGQTVNIGGNVFLTQHAPSAGTVLPSLASIPQVASASSPADALDAINSVLGPSALTDQTDASAYAGSQATQEAPTAPSAPQATTPAQDPAVAAGAPSGQPAAPVPLPPPAFVSPAAANQLAAGQFANILKGSNVNLAALPPDKQVALVSALPTIMSLANDPKAQLQYLQQNGLYDSLVAAVPSQAPDFMTKMGAGAIGLQLPPTIPQPISAWGLPGVTSNDTNAVVSQAQPLIGQLTNALSNAQQTRQASYDTSPSELGGISAPPSNAFSAPPPSDPVRNLNSTGYSGPSNSPSSDPVANLNSTGYSASNLGNAYSNEPNFRPAADLSSLGIDPSVSVPQYINISKQVQVPADQPIEQGSGVHWDAAQGQYVIDDAPAPAAAPKMITKTIQQRVVNPAYSAAQAQAAAAAKAAQAAAAAKAQAIATQPAAYQAAAAQALSTQPNGDSFGNVGGVSTNGFNLLTGGQGGSNSSASRSQSPGGSLTGSNWG